MGEPRIYAFDVYIGCGCAWLAVALGSIRSHRSVLPLVGVLSDGGDESVGAGFGVVCSWCGRCGGGDAASWSFVSPTSSSPW